MERQLPILILAAGGVAVLIISANAEGFGPLQLTILVVCIVAAALMWAVGRRSAR
jgi:hypothetical protein